MKTNLKPIPTGKVAAPKSTVPHALLANFFRKMAGLHSRAAAGANSPDRAVSPLPRPDKAAINAQRPGGYQGRMPVIGQPNSTMPQSF